MKKFHKRVLCVFKSVQRLFFVCMILLCWSGNSSAHPPSEISVDYDIEKQEAQITVLHRTRRRRKHFIRRIVVWKKGEEILDEPFSFQSDLKEQVVSFPVSLEEGDALLIKVFCRQAGVKTREWVFTPETEEGDL